MGKDTTKASGPSSERSTRLVPGAVERQERGKRVVGVKGLKIVERMARDGHGDATISKALRMSQECFRQCRRRQPEVAEALALGRGALEAELADILLRQARQGNTVAAIFLAKARCGWIEGAPPADAKANVVIMLPGALEPAEYMRRIEAGSGSPGGREVGTLPAPSVEERD